MELKCVTSLSCMILSRYLCEFLIIAMAILASLASVAYKIAIEKDWIVVVAGQDSGQLASK